MMTMARIATQDGKDQRIEGVLRSLQSEFTNEIKLFRPEIQISIAYCDSLFEAGIFNRLESERVKNALQTILKRSEFDKNYFDNSKSQNIFEFIEKRLVHLVGGLGLKIQIGRGIFDRNSTVLRFWLRQEISEISKLLLLMQEAFIKLAEENKSQVLIAKVSSDDEQVILFPHWCLANFEGLKRNREILEEVWRRVNTMPLGADIGTGTSLEFDRQELAEKLGFQRITTNSLDAIRNLDFLAEFVNLSTIIATQFDSLINELSSYIKSEYISCDIDIKPETLNLIKGKLNQVFSYQVEIQNNLRSERLKFDKKFGGNREAIIECVADLKTCLNAFVLVLDSIKINQPNLDKDLESILPGRSEIFDYLVQRDQTVELAHAKTLQIETLLRSNEKLENTKLESLKNISPIIEADFYEELELENILNRKNQIGGTSHERVLEALDDAKKALEYEK